MVTRPTTGDTTMLTPIEDRYLTKLFARLWKLRRLKNKKR